MVDQSQNPPFSYKCNSIREFTIDVSPVFSAHLVYDGQEKKPTKSNLKKVLAFASGQDVSDTIFYSLARVKNTDSLSNVVLELMDNPWIEKLYSAGDDRLQMYLMSNGSREQMDHTKDDLIHNLKLNKSMFRFVMEYKNNLLRNYVYLHDIWALMEKYGNQKAENILRDAINIGNDGDVYGRPLRSFLQLMMMDGVNFEHSRLIQYLNNDLDTYQGIDSVESGAILLMDYIENCKEMGVAFEKYPRSLKLVHDISAKKLENHNG